MWYWINGRIDNVEEKISKLECRATAINQKETERKKNKILILTHQWAME